MPSLAGVEIYGSGLLKFVVSCATRFFIFGFLASARTVYGSRFPIRPRCLLQLSCKDRKQKEYLHVLVFLRLTSSIRWIYWTIGWLPIHGISAAQRRD